MADTSVKVLWLGVFIPTVTDLLKPPLPLIILLSSLTFYVLLSFSYPHSFPLLSSSSLSPLSSYPPSSHLSSPCLSSPPFPVFHSFLPRSPSPPLPLSLLRFPSPPRPLLLPSIHITMVCCSPSPAGISRLNAARGWLAYGRRLLPASQIHP